MSKAFRYHQHGGPDVLRFVPALNISDADIAEGLKRLRAALTAFAQATP